MQKIYLRLLADNQFSFVFENEHKILSSDIEIKEDDYNLFFELQQSIDAKEFKLKEVPTGKNLFDFVEVYKTPVDTNPKPPTLEERTAAIENLLMGVI